MNHLEALLSQAIAGSCMKEFMMVIGRHTYRQEGGTGRLMFTPVSDRSQLLGDLTTLSDQVVVALRGTQISFGISEDPVKGVDVSIQVNVSLERGRIGT